MTPSQHSYTVKKADSPTVFAQRAGTLLSTDEARYTLLLGHCLRMQQHPERYQGAVCRIVTSDRGGDKAVLLGIDPLSWLVSDLDANATGALVAALRSEDLRPPGIIGPHDSVLRFADAWRPAESAHRVVMHQRVFSTTNIAQPPHPGGALRVGGGPDRGLVVQWARAFAVEAGLAPVEHFVRFMEGRLVEGDVFLWEHPEDGVVALVGVAGHSPSGARVGPVYTPPPHRGRGFGTKATAAVSQRLIDEGKTFCCLFTDLSNPTSNRIYPRIGYEPIGDYLEIGLDG